MCLLPGCLFVKDDRRTDEDARKGDQSSERTNVGDSADFTGENGENGDRRKAATFQHFAHHRFFYFFRSC